jgi:hypothetical protein
VCVRVPTATVWASGPMGGRNLIRGHRPSAAQLCVRARGSARAFTCRLACPMVGAYLHPAAASHLDAGALHCSTLRYTARLYTTPHTHCSTLDYTYVHYTTLHYSTLHNTRHMHTRAHTPARTNARTHTAGPFRLAQAASLPTCGQPASNQNCCVGRLLLHHDTSSCTLAQVHPGTIALSRTLHYTRGAHTHTHTHTKTHARDPCANSLTYTPAHTDHAHTRARVVRAGSLATRVRRGAACL